MMSANSLSQAIALAKAGKKEEARQILTQLLEEDLHNETAWLWLVDTIESPTQRIATLERCLKHNPNSQTAHRVLEKLQAGQPAPAPIPTTDETLKPLLQALRKPLASSSPSPKPPAAREEPPPPVVDKPAAGPKVSKPTPPNPTPKQEPEKPPSPPPSIPPEHTTPPPSIPLGQATPPVQPPPVKKTRLNAMDIGAIVLIFLVIIFTAGYLLWGKFAPSITSRPTQTVSAALLATAARLETENAQIKTTLTAVLNITPTPTNTPILTFTPTASATPSPTPITVNLPAPVYFLSGLLGGDPQNPAPGSYQVWRLETNGISLSQITNEAKPVEALDVSPADATLAYVSDNQLILANPDGTNRRVLAGSPLPPNPAAPPWTTQVTSPAWSPDGARLAYGLNGVEILDLAKNSTTSLIRNVIPAANKPQDLRLYEPRLWSPDGRKILTLAREQQCGIMTILPAEGGKPTATFNEENDLFTWSADSAQLFNANPVPGGTCGSNGGLWQVDAATGVSTALVANQADAATLQLFGWPKLTADDRLEYFYAEGPASDLTGKTFPHLLYQSKADGVTGRAAVSREDFYFFDEAQYSANGSAAFGDVLWSPDGSYAVITAALQAGGTPDFWLLRMDGTPAVKLAESPGNQLHWGVLSR